MEAPFQIVGCVLSSTPDATRIDELVTLLRRERAVVMAKDARGATFVRLSASDTGLILLACQTVLDPALSTLRFGFASGIKSPTARGQEGIGNRSVAQANELAEGARDGEVLVSPQLALLLIESGVALHSRQVHLPDGRVVPACSLDLSTGAGRAPTRGGHAAADPRAIDSLGSAYRSMATQASDMAHKQAELEARLDAALGKVTLVDQGDKLARHLGELEAEMDAQLLRVQERLVFIDRLEERMGKLDLATSNLERRWPELLARREELESLRKLCDDLVSGMQEAQLRFDALLPAQQQIQTLLPQVQDLSKALSESQVAVAAFEARLAELDRHAETVEQKIKSLAEREALVQAVRAEVEQVRQISSKSKADLQFVSEHRNDVTELRDKIEDLMGRLAQTDGQIELIESRRKMVEEVQQRAGAITHMLGDINVNLEMLSEQRAVIDHVGEKVARLDFTVQEAQNTLRALQREREVAERIEQGIKALRTRSGKEGRVIAPLSVPPTPSAHGEPQAKD